MHIDWNRRTLCLAANPTAVARHLESLPSVALNMLRLLDGHKTVQDTIRISKVEEETARAILRRLIELGLASPVDSVEPCICPRAASLSGPLKAWIAEPSERRRQASSPQASPLDEVDALFADLEADLPTPMVGAPGSRTDHAAPDAPGLTPPPTVLAAFSAPQDPVVTSLEDALLGPLGAAPMTPEWSEQDLAFFDSYVPVEPMTDTFSDLVSKPRRR